MKNNHDFLAAIDIGTTKIVALIGRKNESNRIEVFGLTTRPSTGVKRGVVLNIEETTNAIKEAVDELQTKADVKIAEVYVGIAGQHIKSIRTRGYVNRVSYEEEIKKSDIDALIADMHRIPVEIGEEIIHVLPQNFIVDNETGVKNPIGMLGKRLEGNFHIVIGQITSAKNMEKCINRVGMNVNSFILEPLASADAVLTEDERELGVALVDIGGGTTDLAVYYDGIIRHTAVIPFGGNVITDDIRQGCGILAKQAEALKIQYGSALGEIAPEDKVVTIPGLGGRDPKEITFRTLAHIIQSRMEEILDTVMYEIENSDLTDKLNAGIVITGGGAMLKNLPQLIKYRTGLDVRIGYPNININESSVTGIENPMYSTGIGLLMRGYCDMEDKHPQTVQQQIAQKQTKKERTIIETIEEKDKKPLLESLKQGFSKFFEEKDAEM